MAESKKKSVKAAEPDKEVAAAEMDLPAEVKAPAKKKAAPKKKKTEKPVDAAPAEVDAAAAGGRSWYLSEFYSFYYYFYYYCYLSAYQP